jgi:hypothetical protein
MKLARSARRALIGFGVVIVLLGAAAFSAPSVVARYALPHYLRKTRRVYHRIFSFDLLARTIRPTVVKCNPK